MSMRKSIHHPGLSKNSQAQAQDPSCLPYPLLSDIAHQELATAKIEIPELTDDTHSVEEVGFLLHDLKVNLLIIADWGKLTTYAVTTRAMFANDGSDLTMIIRFPHQPDLIMQVKIIDQYIKIGFLTGKGNLKTIRNPIPWITRGAKQLATAVNHIQEIQSATYFQRGRKVGEPRWGAHSYGFQ